MSTYRELTYFVLDQLKLVSDDSYYTEDHVVFLLSKVRSYLLYQKYKKEKQEIPESNYQTICLNVEPTQSIPGVNCSNSYLKSTVKIPDITNIGQVQVYSNDYYDGNITYVSKERMRFVGNNKWLQNIIYASIGPDQYLYLKSNNPQFLFLNTVNMSAIFEDIDEASELESCSNTESEETTCDVMDKRFPIDEDLIPQLLELVLKYLTGAIYKPADTANDASDNLSDIANFLRRNMKSNFQKQIED